MAFVRHPGEVATPSWRVRAQRRLRCIKAHCIVVLMASWV